MASVSSTTASAGFDASQSEKLERYCDLIKHWNQSFNLISAQDIDALWSRHILDSLSIVDHLQGKRIIDIGTGAGLPGIPLAIARPELSFTLLDTNNKKTRFCQQAVIELGLKNVEVVHTRAEKFRPPQPFSTIVTRAVADLATLIKLSGHLLTNDGQMVAMKGCYPDDELKAVPASWVVHNIAVASQVDAPERHIIVLRKAES